MIKAIDYRRVSLFLRRLNNTVNALTGNGAFYDKPEWVWRTIWQVSCPSLKFLKRIGDVSVSSQPFSYNSILLLVEIQSALGCNVVCTGCE